MPEMIQEGVSGLQVPREQVGPLADALIALLANPDRAARIGQAGYRRPREELTWTRVAERCVGHLIARNGFQVSFRG
jgi:glycosyltransferase involved in cell wall biosynthesis